MTGMHLSSILCGAGFMISDVLEDGCTGSTIIMINDNMCQDRRHVRAIDEL